MDEMERLHAIGSKMIADHARVIDRERRFALSRGDFMGYVKKTIEGGFEVEQEVIDANFEEYNNYINHKDRLGYFPDTNYKFNERKFKDLRKMVNESFSLDKR